MDPFTSDLFPYRGYVLKEQIAKSVREYPQERIGKRSSFIERFHPKHFTVLTDVHPFMRTITDRRRVPVGETSRRGTPTPRPRRSAY